MKIINQLLRKKGLRGCEVCGENRWLDVHHENGDWQNNDLENLVVLCPNHHAAVERPPLIERICAMCGEWFLSSSVATKRRPVSFCSRQCRERKIGLLCQECGETFLVGANNKMGRDRLYCSKSCQGRAMAKRRWTNASRTG
jgi:ribosomal protein L33